MANILPFGEGESTATPAPGGLPLRRSRPGYAASKAAPGLTYSYMTDQILHAGEERTGWKEHEEALQSRITGGVAPDKQIQLALFLASPRSNHISGKLIHVATTGSAWRTRISIPRSTRCGGYRRRREAGHAFERQWGVMPVDIFSDEFARSVSVATDRARRELLASGVEVVYRDSLTGIDVLERPDGRCFEIRFLPEGDPNYEILRELPERQAA